MADFKRDLLFYGGINTYTGSMYNIGNITMLGNGSYLRQLEVQQLSVTGNAVIPGLQFDSLTVAGNVVSGGNFIGNGALMTGVTSTLPTQANIDIIGNVTASGNVTAQYFIGNGSALTGLLSTLPATANIDITGNVTAPGNVNAGQLTVAGNVQGQYFIGNGSALSGVMPLITGGVANVDIFGNVVAPGNVMTAGKLVMLGNAVGDYFIGNGALLTGLSAVSAVLPPTGNIDIRGNVIAPGNVVITGQLTVSGNVQGNYFLGNGALLSGVTPAISGGVANVDIFGNVTAPGNVMTAGRIVMLGNATGDYFIGNGALLSGLSAVSGILPPTGNMDIRGNVIAPGNIIVAGQVNVTGNVAAQYFVGNGSLLRSLKTTLPSTANVDIRGNVTAPGNITAAGKVVATGGNIQARYFLGNGATLVGITKVNPIIPPTANTDIVGNVRASGNITAEGKLNVFGNVVGRYFIGDGSRLTGVQANAVTTFTTGSGATTTTSNLILTTNRYISATVTDSATINLAAVGVDTGGNLTALSSTGVVRQTNLEGYLVVPQGDVPDMQARLTFAGGNAPIGSLVTETDTGNVYLLTASPSNYAPNWLEVGSGNDFHVSNVFGRTGDVIANYGDYSDDYITLSRTIDTVPAGNTLAVALEYLQTAKANIIGGNVTANYFNGNGSLLTGLGNLVSKLPSVGRSDIRGNVIAPGNINAHRMTVVGNFNGVTANTFLVGIGSLLTGVTYSISSTTAYSDVRGNVVAPGNIICNRLVVPASNVSANCFIGNGSLLTGIQFNYASNVNSDIVGNVTAPGSAAMVRVFGQVNVAGNVSGGLFNGNGSMLTDVPNFGGNIVANIATLNDARIFRHQTPFMWNPTWMGDPTSNTRNIILATAVNSLGTGGLYGGIENGWQFCAGTNTGIQQNCLAWVTNFDFYRDFKVNFAIFITKLTPKIWISVGGTNALDGQLPTGLDNKALSVVLDYSLTPGPNSADVYFAGLRKYTTNGLHAVANSWMSYELSVRTIAGRRFVALKNLTLGTNEVMSNTIGWAPEIASRGPYLVVGGYQNPLYPCFVYLNDISLAYL